MLNRFAIAFLSVTTLVQPLQAQDLFLDETVGFPSFILFNSISYITLSPSISLFNAP